MKNVFALYKEASLWVKFHNFVRWHTCPFQKISTFVPRKGKILELGCGYGLMSNLLSLESGEREVIGIDISEKKITVAKKTVGARENVRFEISEIHNSVFFNQRYHCIIILDVLYLLPFADWEYIGSKCFQALERGGLLLIKEQGTYPRWKYYWNRVQEFLSVRIFKITEGRAFTFPNEETIKELLISVGFYVESFKMDKGYLHPHILFVCKKL